MHQIIFIASSHSVESLEWDENPADSFPCMSTQQFHKDARAQLYALVTNEFLDTASEMEYLDQSVSDEGPFIYQYTDALKAVLAGLDEEQVEGIAELWMQCEELELLNLETNDSHDFMFQLIHFCQIACNDELGVYVYADD